MYWPTLVDPDPLPSLPGGPGGPGCPGCPGGPGAPRLNEPPDTTSQITSSNKKLKYQSPTRNIKAQLIAVLTIHACWLSRGAYKNDLPITRPTLIL